MPALNIDMDLPWGQFRSLDIDDVELPWGKMQTEDSNYTVPWIKMDQRDQAMDLPFAEMLHRDAEMVLLWIQTFQRDQQMVLPWWAVIQCNRERIIPWAATVQCGGERILPWYGVIQCDRGRFLPWAETGHCDHEQSAPWQINAPLDYWQQLPWVRMRPCDRDYFTPYDPHGQPPLNPNDPGTPAFLCTNENIIPWLKEPRVIMIKQEVTVIRVSDSEPVHFLNLRLSSDLDSYGWSFSGNAASLADASLISPESGPVEIQVSINGYIWRFLVESISTGHRYGDGSYSVQGVSKSVAMTEPYAAPKTQVYTSTLDASALMYGELASGWSLDSSILDWSIPGDLFSVQNQTPIQIISRIVKTVEGRVQTHPSTDTLILMPRVPITPADWPTETPDETILSSEIFTKSVKWEPSPGFNRVFVSGETQGVLTDVRRTGTMYDIPMDPVIDKLILTQAVAKERGRNLLDQSGYDKSVITIETPLPGATSGLRPGLLTPGKLVEVEDLWSTWRGLVRSLTISVNRIGITQQAELERYHVA